MSGFEEVARISAVVEADLTPFERGMAQGEARGQVFASKTQANMSKAEGAVYRSSASMAKALERSAVAHSAAAAAADRAIDKIVVSQAKGAAGAEKSAAVTSAAMKAQASAAMQAGAQMGTSYAKMAASAEKAAAMQQAALGRAAVGAKAHAQASAHAAAQVVASNERQATSATKSAIQTREANAAVGKSYAGTAARAGGFARSLGTGLGLVGGYGAAAAIAGVLKTGATFEATMSGVRAATGATEAEFQALQGTAMALGASTTFSATEVGAAMTELGKSGFNAQQNIAAMPGVLDAATASGEGIAEVAHIAADALAQFNLDAAQSGRVADVLAKAANETQGTVTGMGTALSYAGTQAAQLGFSIEQTTGMVSMMVKAGIDGSQAGTAVRMGLQQMALGANISKMDLTKIRGISPELERIQKSSAPVPQKLLAMSREFQKLDGTSRTTAASLIFGTHASSGMLEVLKGGPGPIQKWVKSMEDARGTAHAFGLEVRDNLKGDVEQLKGASETASIKAYNAKSGDLRERVQKLTVHINSAEFQGELQSVISGVLNVGEAIAETTAFVYDHRSALMAAATAYLALRTAAAAAGTAQAIAGAAGMIGGRGRAVAGVGQAATIASTGAAAAASGAKLASFAKYASMAARGITGIGLATVGAQLLWQLAKAGSGAGESADEARARIAELRTEIDKLKPKTIDVVVRTTKVTGGGKGPKVDPARAPAEIDVDSADTVKAMASEYEKATDRMTAAEKRVGEAVDDNRSKQALAAEGRREYQREFEGVVDGGLSKIDAADSLPVEAAQRRYEALADAAADASKELDGSNKGLADARTVMREAEAGMQGLYQKLSGIDKVKVTGSVAKKLVSDMSDAQRQAAFGTTKINAAMAKLGYVSVSGQWYRSLGEYTALVKVAASGTQKDVNAALALIGATDPSGQATAKFLADVQRMRAAAARAIIVNAYVVTHTKDINSGGGMYAPGAQRATGGAVTGKGTGTSDEIPVWMSNGEHVITAAEVAAAGGHDAVYRMRKAMAAGEMPAFAKGGTFESGPKGNPRPGRRKGEKDDAYSKRVDTWQNRVQGFDQKATNLWQGKVDSWGLKEAGIDRKLAAAEAVKGQKGKDQQVTQLQALAKLYAEEAKGATAFQGTPAFKLWFDKAEKSGVIGMGSGAVRSFKSTNDRIAELGGKIVIGKGLGDAPVAEDTRTAYEKMQEKYALRFAKLDEELARAEGIAGFDDDAEVLGRRAAAYGEQAGEIRGLLPSLVGDDLTGGYSDLAAATRGQQDSLDAKKDGESAITPDMQAQLDQEKTFRETETRRANLSEAALGTFGGSGDIGYGGGGNAYGSAGGMRSGGMVVNINALAGSDPQTKQHLATALNGGFNQGGFADQLYSGRR